MILALNTPLTQCQTLLVKREPTNSKDSNAVGVYQEGTIVGHVPVISMVQFNISVFEERC